MKASRILIAAVLCLVPASFAVAQPAPSGQIVRIPGGEDKLKAEEALRATIAAFASGKPNYADMETPLADAVKLQSGTLSAGLEQLGALTTIEYKGWTPAGSGVFSFDVGFEHGKAQWLIGFGDGGKIQTLWFKPL
jgi:hypothetical protein